MNTLLLIALAISFSAEIFPDWTIDPMGCSPDMLAQAKSEGLDRYEVSIESDGRMIIRHVRVFPELIPSYYDELLPITLAWDPTHMAEPQIRTRCIGEGESFLKPSQLSQRALYESERDSPTALRVLEAMPDVSETLVVDTSQVWNRPGQDDEYSGIFELQGTWSEIILKVPTKSLPLVRFNGLTRHPDVTEGDHTIQHFSAHNGHNTWFQFSYASDWASRANRYADMVEKLLSAAFPGEVPSKLIVKGDKGKSALQVTQWLEKMITPAQAGISMIPAEPATTLMIPAEPATTLMRKAGSSADKAILLCALLRKADIGAKIALIAPRSGRPYLEAYKVAVYLPEERVWIEPASRFQSTAALPFEDLGKEALIIEDAKLTPGNTPDHDSYDGVVTYQSRNDLRDLGEPTFQSQVVYSGKAADDERSLMLFWRPAWLWDFDWEQDYSKNPDHFDIPIHQQEGALVLLPCHGPTTAFLTFKESYFEKDFWTTQGADQKLTECREYKTVEEFLIPSNYNLVTPVKEGTFPTKVGTYERHLVQEPGRVVITSSFFPSQRVWDSTQAKQAAKQLHELQNRLGGDLKLEFHPVPGKQKSHQRGSKLSWILGGLLLLGVISLLYWRSRRAAR